MIGIGKAAGLVVCVGLLAGGAASPALALPFTTISVPGADQTFAEGINNSGEIVGNYYSGTNAVIGGPAVYGFTDVGGAITTFQVTTAQAPLAIPGATLIFGVSNNGTLGGSYIDSLGNQYGFLDAGGVFTSLNDPNADPAFGQIVSSVNDYGEAVGIYIDSSGVEHGFSWSSGTGFATVDSPAGSLQTVAGGVTDNGDIYGDYIDASGNAHGFEQTAGGVFTTLDDPAHVGSSFINEGNAEGELTGAWLDSSGDYHPYVAVGGSYHDLSLPAVTAQPWGINDNGQVVGFYQASADGPNEGFLTAVPEPQTWAMMLVGIGLMGASLRRRRVHPLCEDGRRAGA
jgi:hypothetical protein